MNLSDARNWWESTFSSSLVTKSELPDPDAMSLFWLKKFPILALLSDSITNTNQYWRRIQRIMMQMSSKNKEIPCPFQRFKQFILSFYQFVKELDAKSISQVLVSLECIPQTYDPQIILWRIPFVIDNPKFFLTLLDVLYISNHSIWNNLISFDGGCDLILDRFLPYIIPISENDPKETKDFNMITINMVVSALLNQSRLPDLFESFFNSILLILKNGTSNQSIHCFRLLINLFKSNRFNISTEQLNNYVKLFAESSITNPLLKPFVGPFVLSLNIETLSIIFLSNLYLRNIPDQNDILFIERNLINSSENANSIILRLLSLSTTDKIYCATYLHAINSLKSLFASNMPSVSFFIKRAVGFIIIAKSRNSKRRTVSMIFDLLKTLSNLGHEWLKNEVSNGAAILLASQKVPLAFVNSLRPSIQCDKSELVKWEKLANDSKLNIKDLLSEKGTLSFSLNKSNSNFSTPNTNLSINPSSNKCQINKSFSSQPKPPVGTRSAPMRNPRLNQKGNISSISKPKPREVKKPIIKASQNKFFQNYRENQS